MAVQSACDENSPARGRDRVMENRIREIEGLPPLPEPASEFAIERFVFSRLTVYFWQLPPLSRMFDPASTGVKTPRSNESTAPCPLTLPVKPCFDRSLFSPNTCETTNSYSPQWKRMITQPTPLRSRNTSPGRKRRSTRSSGEVVRPEIRTANGKETHSMTGGTSIGLGWR